MISFFTTENEADIKLEPHLYLSKRGFVLTTASQRWWHSVQQQSLSCDIAFIQQFYELCFGLVNSNEKKTDHFWLFVCSFKHLFASADANGSTTRQYELLLKCQPLNLVLGRKHSVSEFVFNETPCDPATG